MKIRKNTTSPSTHELSFLKLFFFIFISFLVSLNISYCCSVHILQNIHADSLYLRFFVWISFLVCEFQFNFVHLKSRIFTAFV